MSLLCFKPNIAATAPKEKNQPRRCTVAPGTLQNPIPVYLFILIKGHLLLTNSSHDDFLSAPQVCQLLVQGLFTSTFWNVLPPALTITDSYLFFRSQITQCFFHGLPSPTQLCRLHIPRSFVFTHCLFPCWSPSTFIILFIRLYVVSFN